MIKVTWKQKTTPYSNGKSAYLGKINVGSVDWDSCSSDKNLRYKITSTLPQFPKSNNYKTEQLAIARFERCLYFWLNGAGLVE